MIFRICYIQTLVTMPTQPLWCVKLRLRVRSVLEARGARANFRVHDPFIVYKENSVIASIANSNLRSRSVNGDLTRKFNETAVK